MAKFISANLLVGVVSKGAVLLRHEVIKSLDRINGAGAGVFVAEDVRNQGRPKMLLRILATTSSGVFRISQRGSPTHPSLPPLPPYLPPLPRPLPTSHPRPPLPFPPLPLEVGPLKSS